MFFVSYGTSFVKGTASFRLPWALQMIPALVLLIFLPMMPRSPRWLASKDRWDEATEVLARLHAGGNQMDPLIIAEVNQIRDAIRYDNVPLYCRLSIVTNVYIGWKPNSIASPGLRCSNATILSAQPVLYSPTSGRNTLVPML